MSGSDPCVTSETSSASGDVYSSPDSHSSSPINAIGGPPSSSSLSYRTTSSGASSDDSRSSRWAVYDANIARQLLALKEGKPSENLTRRQRNFIDETRKDAAYWERRRKNNEAAKRSREKRRVSDMALEAQVNQVLQDMESLREELKAIKRHYGLDSDQPFVPPPVDPVKPTLAPLSVPHIRLPHPGSSSMVRPPQPRGAMLRPMHPSGQVFHPLPHCQPCLSNAGMSSSGGDEGYWTNEQQLSNADSEANQRQEDQSYESNEFAEDAYQESSQQTQEEQDKPLNLVMKQEKQNKETSEELSIRMNEEVAMRYEEIKAGSVDHIAEAKRESGMVSPGSSTSSTSSGSVYAKRLRVDESDSIMDSISTASENTFSEAQTPNLPVLDSKHLERRKKNNEASRRTRENRKHNAKTFEEKTDVLELENNKLRQELNSLALAVSNLKEMIVAGQEQGKQEPMHTNEDAEKEVQTACEAS